MKPAWVDAELTEGNVGDKSSCVTGPRAPRAPWNLFSILPAIEGP